MPYLFPIGSRLGEDNLVLRARAAHHRVDGYAGPLSIKTVVSGRVAWIVSGRELVVEPSSFLILSAGERYSMNIAAEKPVETCCAFFAPGFIERAAFDMTSALEQALENLDRLAPELPYLSRLHNDRERRIVHDVQALAGRCATALTPSGFEEDFLALAIRLLHLYQQIREQMARLPAIRSATRQELYRRLLIGRDYFHSRTSKPVSLREVARAACLSPFHFHRGFTHAFRQTPHQYLTDLRLSRARSLLESGFSVLSACLDAGFSSPSAFSRLFRTRYGVPPSAIRLNFARSGKNAR